MELGMYFTKASLHEDGTMHWAATVTDTDEDNHGERVDRSFFANAIKNAEAFGLPYVCTSHYDFKDKGISDEEWISGRTDVLFEDGERFKAKGVFFDTPLGKANFEAVREDIQNDTPHDERVRISQGFYDKTKEEEKSETTEDGSTRKVYKDGIIKHLATTRVPVLPRTEIEAWKEKAVMTTKLEDATSIIGEELAGKLEELNKEVGKSEAEDLVIKSTEEIEPVEKFAEEKVLEKLQEMKSETELTEMAKKKEKKEPKKVDKDFEYGEEEPGKDTMAEEMWTETPEEGGVPGQDQAAKRKNIEELKKAKKKKKSEVVEMMIKDEDGKVVLYSKDGSKTLGSFPYGEGKKYADKDAAMTAAMTAAKKREGQVQYFKNQKKSETLENLSETLENLPDDWEDRYSKELVAKIKARLNRSVVDETEEEGVVEEAELEEKAGRRVSAKRLKGIEGFQKRLDEIGELTKRLNEDVQTWHDDASYTPEDIVNTSTEMQPVPVNPVVEILEGGTPETAIMASDFDDKMAEFATDIYSGITDNKPEALQDSLNMIADAIKAELNTSMAEVGDSEAKSEVDVEAKEVEQSVTAPLDVFNMRVKVALTSGDLDRRGKLQACQNALSEVGGFIQQSVVENTSPSMGDIREVIVAAVHEGTKGLIEDNVTQKARINDLEQMIAQLRGEQIINPPVQKSITQIEIDVDPEDDKEFYSAREVARRSMPPGVVY